MRKRDAGTSRQGFFHAGRQTAGGAMDVESIATYEKIANASFAFIILGFIALLTWVWAA